MKYSARLASCICLATSVMVCLSVFCSSTTRFVAPVHAERESITGSVSSSPSSGPIGATISVSGSGWSEPDGEQVSLGYMIESICLPVSDAQASTFKSGSFSGWLYLPNETPPGTYLICATFGSKTEVANNYMLLSVSPPQISITLSTQAREQQATISGSNYFPAGTTVNLFWESTNGSPIFTIKPAVSNSNGSISRTFMIPTSITSGSYKIAASVSGQPALNSTVTFTYNAPTPTPTPTPSPTPSPVSDPTPVQKLSPTVVTTPVATAISTQTVEATTPVSSQNTNTDQTPSSSTSSKDANTPIVLVGATIGVLALLATSLIIVLVSRRRKVRSIHPPAVTPTQTSPISWQNNQFGDMPYPTNNSSMAVPPWTAVSTSPPQPLQISPYAHLLQQPEGGSSGLTNESTKLTLDDPNIESIKQQVQMGLFATSGHRRDE
jgi:hypothetical protein